MKRYRVILEIGLGTPRGTETIATKYLGKELAEKRLKENAESVYQLVRALPFVISAQVEESTPATDL